MSMQQTKRHQIFSKKFGNTNESKFLCDRNCSHLANIRSKRIFLMGASIILIYPIFFYSYKKSGVVFATNDKAFLTPIE
jgi:hypothetical protein